MTMPDDEWAYRVIAFCLGILFAICIVVMVNP